MKFGFVTCVQLGKSCIEAIYDVGGKLDLVITLQDNQAINKSGRIFLDDFCNVHNIPLLKSAHINNEECVQSIKEHEIDWLFIIGWSQIATETLLLSPTKGVLGMHPTLLPKGRGRASLPWAIIKDLKQTGVTLFKLDEGVDTGDILDQEIIPLNKYTTATELYGLVNESHVELIKKIFPKLQSNTVKLVTQNNEQATEWPGRSPYDGEIDLTGSIFNAEKLIRAVTRPYPGAYVTIDGVKIIIWESKIMQTGSINLDKTISFYDGELKLIDYQIVE